MKPLNELDQSQAQYYLGWLLRYIGEDLKQMNPDELPLTREGLVETPKRIVNSWREIFSGYGKDPADLMKTFDGDGHDQIVVLKDIEIYSMCEHHMLPFVGKAHVAYVPDKRVLGVSKLARLVDLFARRLQIQERLGDQVVDALMQHLQPRGAVCIIEAVHYCMRMRGVSKQHSTMVTSSLRGVFREKDTNGLAARNELMLLIGK